MGTKQADRLFRVLLVLGGIATLVHVPLHLVPLGPGEGFRRLALWNLHLVIYYVTGAFTYWQRPDHPAARRLLATGACFNIALAIGLLVTLAAAGPGLPGWFWLGNALNQAFQIAAFCAAVALFAVFPDGVYQRPHERWIARAVFVLVPTTPLLLLLARPTVFFNPHQIWVESTAPSPFYLPALAGLGSAAAGLYEGRLLLPLLGAGLLGLRYRRFAPEQRLQIIWPFLAALAFGLLLAFVRFAIQLGGLFPREIGSAIFVLGSALLPLALAVGLLRHRLFDIKVVFRQSLVYGTLWLGITLGYAALAAALGLAAGERVPVGAAILCTIVAALLFQPARQRLERLADRWVFGERSGDYELLSRFGATLEGAFDLDEMVPRVAATVRLGLGVDWVRVSLWHDAGAGRTLDPVGAEGIGLHDPARPIATAPLVCRGEQIGAIGCGPKAVGQFDARDHELLATLGRQAALAIRNAGLAAELRERLADLGVQARELAASRARIVQAAETERRRIERNIHDGAQQQLVALLAKLRLARNQLARDAQLAAPTLAELQEDARQALEDLRELARGIAPPVLSDRGLLEAIEARIARLPIGVAVEPVGIGRGTRYAEEVEGAAYFFVCEGLTNVLKHAQARRATVRLDSVGETLRIEVSDDGCGFDPGATPHSGLRGLADRIEALGGQIQVRSRPTSGTTLATILPIVERRDD